MPGRRPAALDVDALLERVSAAAPIEAVEAVGEALAQAVGARAVTFLIADFSGRSVVRLTSSGPAVAGSRDRGDEQAQTLPLPGSVYERVLRSQVPDLADVDGGVCLVVPVTDRGDATGLIELMLPYVPAADSVAEVSAGAHALAFVVIAARRHGGPLRQRDSVYGADHSLTSTARPAADPGD